MKKWKERLNNLPVIISDGISGDGKTLKGKKGGVVYRANQYYTPSGNIISFSIFGTTPTRKKLLGALQKELGEPISITNNPFLRDGLDIAWKSEKTDIPKTWVWRALGESRFNEVFRAYRISDEEQKKIFRMLADYSSTPGMADEIASILLEKDHDDHGVEESREDELFSAFVQLIKDATEAYAKV